MTVKVYKNGGAWNFLAFLFKIKSYGFKKIVVEKIFLYYPEASYPTNVIFQQFYRPCGTVVKMNPHSS